MADNICHEPALGAFIYIEHDELKMVRVIEQRKEIWEQIELAGDHDYIEVTVRRLINEAKGEAPPTFIEEPMHLRRDKIIAFA